MCQSELRIPVRITKRITAFTGIGITGKHVTLNRNKCSIIANKVV